MRPLRAVVPVIVLSAATAALVLVTARQTGERVSLLLTGGIVVTMNAAGEVLDDGAVAIAGDRIVAVGRSADIAQRYDGAERIDVRGQVILPGLVNTHTHVPMVLYRGLADDYSLEDWLTKYIFPAEAKTVSPEFVRIGTRLGVLEMIESGTTTFADMYYFEDEIAEVTKAAGLRAVLGQSVIRFPVADAPTPEAALARAEAFIARFRGDALITPAVAPHAPTTVSADTLRAARALATRYDVPLLIHLAETREEVRQVQAERRATPARYLDSLGVWNGRSLAAHAVWLDEAEMTLLAARGVGVAHNPGSNMKLASGIAAVPRWLERGMTAGLGTDGAASSNDLDMFTAMRLAALLHKVGTMNPQAMPARLVLEMATIRGAAALGLADRIGSLEAGKQADVITVSMEGARQSPMFDPISHLVYVSHGDDVRTVVVNGSVLMRERQVLSVDRQRTLTDAHAMALRVRQAVGAAAASRGGR